MKKPMVFLALVVMLAFAAASSNTDIDYSHNVEGTGTVITDYKIGSSESTEASGKVRGTGDITNKYIFSSSNDSENVTIEDVFLLSQVPTVPKITLADYPQRPQRPDRFRLIGEAWAGGIEVSGPKGGQE